MTAEDPDTVVSMPASLAADQVIGSAFAARAWTSDAAAALASPTLRGAASFTAVAVDAGEDHDREPVYTERLRDPKRRDVGAWGVMESNWCGRRASMVVRMALAKDLAETPCQVLGLQELPPEFVHLLGRIPAGPEREDWVPRIGTEISVRRRPMPTLQEEPIVAAVE